MLSAAEWSPLRLSELAWQVIHASLSVLPSGQRLSTRVPDEPVRVFHNAMKKRLDLHDMVVVGVVMAATARRGGPRARSSKPAIEAEDGATARGPFLAGLLVPASNPGFWIWWTTVGTSFIHAARHWGEVGLGLLLLALIGGAAAWYLPLLWALSRGRQVFSERVQEFTAIPYYAWDHRAPGAMEVWIPEDRAQARPRPVPTIASGAHVAASHVWQNDTGAAVHDQIETGMLGQGRQRNAPGTGARCRPLGGGNANNVADRPFS